LGSINRKKYYADYLNNQWDFANIMRVQGFKGSGVLVEKNRRRKTAIEKMNIEHPTSNDERVHG
jgi:hypothetical protein